MGLQRRRMTLSGTEPIADRVRSYAKHYAQT